MKVHRVALINKNGTVFRYIHFTQRRHANTIARKQKHLIKGEEWQKLITTHDIEISKDGIMNALIHLASHGNRKDIRK